MRRPALLLAMCLIGLALVVLMIPLSARQIGFFRVRQVELVGVRYHTPAEVFAGLALAPDQSLFASKRGIERRAADIPGVIGLKVERKLPGTLKIVVDETQPVAFMAGDSGLVVLDSNGNRMGYDPVRTGLDLPFVGQPDSGLLRALALVGATDSALYRQVDAASVRQDGTILLELGKKKIMLGAAPTAGDIRSVLAVQRYLADSGQTFDQLDARFSNQVIVRRGGD